MSAEDEEDDRIEAAIAAEGWCVACGTPIGWGRCDGCMAVDTDLFFEQDLRVELDDPWWEE